MSLEPSSPTNPRFSSIGSSHPKPPPKLDEAGHPLFWPMWSSRPSINEFIPPKPKPSSPLPQSRLSEGISQ